MRTAGTRAGAALLIGGALLLAGCTHAGFGSTDGHFATFSVPPPKGSPKGAVVHVCHAYGCQKKTRVRFTEADFAEIAAILQKWRTKADTPADERRGVAYAIGWIETKVGNQIGTKDDRPGMDFAGSGDPTQQDCVDEATNTTSYLTVLAEAGLLKHHTVGTPFAKENYLRGVAGWTHWTAVLVENGSKRTYAVDSWIYGNGENPAVVPTEEWYIADLASLPAATR